ncbi:MAG: CheA signal transduction histidine kinase [Firmicutes bacterium]|nr:CheA signal transduction histidine kinase [Bacillota bacterium]
MEIDSSLLDEFVLEAKAHIASIEAGLLRLEEGESDDETINGIFRAAHSIKGTASFFELNKIVELAGNSQLGIYGTSSLAVTNTLWKRQCRIPRP